MKWEANIGRQKNNGMKWEAKKQWDEMGDEQMGR